MSFVFSNIVTEVAMWRASTPLALWSMGWAPFQAEKLGLFTVAVLAPPDPWAGAISIGIFAGSAMAHYASFDPVVRARLLAEPWTTVIYSIFACPFTPIGFTRCAWRARWPSRSQPSSRRARIADDARTFGISPTRRYRRST